MLDTDNTESTTSDTAGPNTAEAVAAPAPRKRAARKAKSPAAAEAEAPSADPAKAAAPARKRAPRKAAKAAAAPPPAAAPDAPAPAAAATDAVLDAPAKKSPRKRPAKKTPSAAKTPATTATETEAVQPAAADEAASEPARPARKRAARARKSVSPAIPDAASSAQPDSLTDATQASTAAGTTAARAAVGATGLLFLAPADQPVPPPAPKSSTDDDAESDEIAGGDAADPEDIREAAIELASGARRRRRRGRRGRGGRADSADATDDGAPDAAADAIADATADATAESAGEQSGEAAADSAGADDAGSDEQGESSEDSARSTRRRRRRRSSSASSDESSADDPPNTVVHVREKKPADDGVKGVKGSTRLEAKRQRRRDGRETTRRRTPILSESEFLARREAVERAMVLRQNGERTQIAVLEDGILVEHYVTRASATSYVGNIYLGRVQNVLPSMEAAFVDIGKGRNGVLYAGEVDWDAAGLGGKSRAIENALKAGDTVLVQVTKDPIGHKGARLTSQISLPGRFLVYVPGGGMTGISRRLPDTERHRLKSILKKIVPEDAGVIVRTAAEGASEEDLTRDVERLTAQWAEVEAAAKGTSSAPSLLHGEPDLATRVVRDVFNEDFTSLVVQGEQAWEEVSGYVAGVAPDLAARVSRHTADTDLFHELRIDEQLMKALDRKVWLPSGGSLVIDRTEAMTVIDVNTGKFVGAGGNLEQTVTRNNLEAAEEIVRQLRLRDVGGIVVIDFIDMVLESNRELVLRRLTECLGRDRTKHQVAEVTSLGLVQMTRKRVGEGLLEAFSEPCEVCGGRGVIVHSEPVDKTQQGADGGSDNGKQQGKQSRRKRGGRGNGSAEVEVELSPAASDEQRKAATAAIAAIHRAAGAEDGEDDLVDSADGDLDSGLHGRVDALATDLVAAVMDSGSDSEAAGPEGAAGVPQPDAAAAVEPDDAEAAAPDSAESDSLRESAQQPPDDAVKSVASAEVGATPPPRRRRRVASRPAGPPAEVALSATDG